MKLSTIDMIQLLAARAEINSERAKQGMLPRLDSISADWEVFNALNTHLQQVARSTMDESEIVASLLLFASVEADSFEARRVARGLSDSDEDALIAQGFGAVTVAIEAEAPEWMSLSV